MYKISTFGMFFIILNFGINQTADANTIDQLPDSAIPAKYKWNVNGSRVMSPPSVNCSEKGNRIAELYRCLEESESNTKERNPHIVSFTRLTPITGAEIGFTSIQYRVTTTYSSSTGWVYFRNASPYCPKGYFAKWNRAAYEHYCVPNNDRSETRENTPKSCPSNKTNPIGTYNGNKYQAEIDFVGSGPFPLKFIRHYNSRLTESNVIGENWSHTYSAYIRITLEKVLSDQYEKQKTLDENDPLRNELQEIYENNPTALIVTANINRPDGTVYHYSNTYNPNTQTTETTQWKGPGDINSKFETVFDETRNKITGFKYSKDLITEYYDLSGRLLSIKNEQGLLQTLTYDSSGKLVSVTGAAGKKLNLTYVGDKVSSIYLSDGRSWNYVYDLNDNLTNVVNPDNTGRIYYYENASYPHALTGIIDERGVRYANYEYDAWGMATASYHGEKTGTLSERIDGAVLSFNSDDSTTITQSNGVLTQYFLSVQNNVAVLTNTSGPGCTDCGTNDITNAYDPYTNYLLSKTQYGITTEYGNYDSNGNLGYRIESKGTSNERRTDYTYDPRFFGKISTITKPSVDGQGRKTVGYTYDDVGNTTSRYIIGYRPNGSPVSRTISYEYNGPLNQLSQIDGPRTDVNDITELEYYPDDPLEGNNRARLKRITTPIGMLRGNIQYSATGKILSEARPNGLTLSYEYYPGNDRLKSLTESDGTTSRTTHWTYLPTGEVNTITVGEGSAQATTMTFGYDAARRLIRISDAAGNYIEYTLDTEGNRKTETVHDSNGTLHRSLAQTFDAYNRLDTTVQANESGNYTFAPDGTLDEYRDGKGTTTEYSYDALKRLIASTRDAGGTDPGTSDALTQYGYNVHDKLNRVTDPNNGDTTYVYDDLGNLLSQTSPDTGTTTFTYDPAGNLITRTDARGQTFTYSYDALNRVTVVQTPYPLDDIRYHYDNCPNGRGRLCSVTQGNEVTTFSYNAYGEVTAHQGVQYAYDALGRVEKITYPSGHVVRYDYDTRGQIEQLDVTHNGIRQPVASDIQYAPFGPLTALTYGNGAQLSQHLDDAYRITAQSVPGIYQRDYSKYDGNGNILGAIDFLGRANDAYDYDAHNRLMGAEGDYGTQMFAYDKNGNRVQQVANGTTRTYQYQPDSNRLTVAANDTILLDANGNTTGDGKHTYRYNAHNRLVGVDSHIAYTYNALGQRKVKEINGHLHTYVYDINGQLIAEYIDGNLTAEYIYLNGAPIAVIKQVKVYYLHTDHLGTPRAVSNQARQVVWRWDSDPFGRTAANDDPDGDGSKFILNLRFPGQYYDEETGLHYNYYRYYDPSTGRYMTSDPIGLQGGLNTYGYALGNPTKFVDLMGLDVWQEQPLPHMPGAYDSPSTNFGVCGSRWYERLAVPDSWGDADFSQACKNHDNCYGCGGESKEKCDSDLQKEIQSSCDKAYPKGSPNHARCYGWAKKFYSAVKESGGDAYKRARENCNCEK